MREDYIITQKRKIPLKAYFNIKTVIGAFFILVAVYILVFMHVFTPLVIYISGLSLAALGLAFLLSGLKKVNGRNQKIIKIRENNY